jgi:hypothetical protein
MAVASRRPLCQGDGKNAFCQGFFHPTRLLSYTLPVVTLRHLQMNSGFLNGHSTVFVVAFVIGTIKLMLFFD